LSSKKKSKHKIPAHKAIVAGTGQVEAGGSCAVRSTKAAGLKLGYFNPPIDRLIFVPWNRENLNFTLSLTLLVSCSISILILPFPNF
jgi:hypothetical protein